MNTNSGAAAEIADSDVVGTAGFSWSASTALKGVAVLLMVFHHCYGFPQWFVSPDLIPSGLGGVTRACAGHAKICVAIFAFLTGWAYYRHKDKSLGYTLRKIVGLMADFAVILFFVMLIACLFCGYKLSCFNILSEFLPFSDLHRLVLFSWYIGFYVIMMCLLPFLESTCQVKNVWCRIVLWLAAGICLVFSTAILNIPHLTVWFPCAVSGYACSRLCLFEKVCSYWQRRSCAAVAAIVFFLLAGVISILSGGFFEYFLPGHYYSSGVITVPLICCGWILLLPAIERLKLTGALMQLGKHSLNIWLLHSVFFSSVTRALFQPVAYAVDSPLYVLPFVVGSCYLASLGIKPLQNAFRGFILRRLEGL